MNKKKDFRPRNRESKVPFERITSMAQALTENSIVIPERGAGIHNTSVDHIIVGTYSFLFEENDDSQQAIATLRHTQQEWIGKTVVSHNKKNPFHGDGTCLYAGYFLRVHTPEINFLSIWVRRFQESHQSNIQGQDIKEWRIFED